MWETDGNIQSCTFNLFFICIAIFEFHSSSSGYVVVLTSIIMCSMFWWLGGCKPQEERRRRARIRETVYFSLVTIFKKLMLSTCYLLLFGLIRPHDFTLFMCYLHLCIYLKSVPHANVSLFPRYRFYSLRLVHSLSRYPSPTRFAVSSSCRSSQYIFVIMFIHQEFFG